MDLRTIASDAVASAERDVLSKWETLRTWDKIEDTVRGTIPVERAIRAAVIRSKEAFRVALGVLADAYADEQASRDK